MKKTILNIIQKYEGIPRVEIANRLSLRFATVTDVVRELIEEGLVMEGEGVDSARGRKATRLEVNAGARTAIGVDIGTENIRAGLVDLKGQVLERMKVPSYGAQGKDAVIKSLRTVLRKMVNMSNWHGPKLLGIGIADPGTVNSKEGISVYASNINGWEDFRIADNLRDIIKSPIIVNEVSKLKAVAENKFGIGKAIKNMLYIDIGIGIGSGIIIDGNLYLGANEVAGEIGHTLVKEDGPLCRCGARGCLEAIAGGRAMAERAKEELKNGVYSTLRDKKGITAKDVFEAAENDDRMCVTLVDESARYIGRAVANFVTLFNPELVVMGGAIVENSPNFVETIQKIVKIDAFRYGTEKLKFSISLLGEDAATIGAASIFIEKFFSEAK